MEDRLNAGQPIVAALVAKELGVSEYAIRRDLRALVAEGKCRRVYGGAMPNSGELPMAARVAIDASSKAHLAQVAADLVAEGETIFIDCGSTNLAIVERIPEDLGLTVVTNSIAIAQSVLERGDINLHIIGGSVDASIGGAVDATAIAALRRFHFDRAFIGACALSHNAEICVQNFADAAFKLAIMDRSVQKVALIKSDKIALRAPYQVAPSSEFSLMIVDAEIPEQALERLKTTGCTVQVAAAIASLAAEASARAPQ